MDTVWDLLMVYTRGREVLFFSSPSLEWLYWQGQQTGIQHRALRLAAMLSCRPELGCTMKAL